ncbi:MAG: sulfatase-like hydrolase/transferase [Verrucomicrobiota bacterium JB023]|nr:sulfatase-like hydrolase/transferase [Verrucomicrobiota bacterium JB023]
MKTFILSLLVIAAASAAERPNILMILADDMGYGDLGCMGSEVIQTPNLDRLAKEGVLCTQGYVPSSVCSPSRAGILTGRDPRRFGYEGNLNKGGDAYATRHELQGLPVTEHTLGDHLKAAGYATALIGKWHQGHREQFHPNQRGFDHFFGMLNGNHNYFPTAERNHLEENGEPVREFSSPYLTDCFTDEAIEWIEEEKERPWFLFASYNAPHTPMQATEADLARFSHIKDKTRRTYAAMMFALDRGVGRLVDYLEEKGERENTLIVFFSDNGGATNNGSWNGPLAGRKGSLREGGVRVPFIFSWPARLPQGEVTGMPLSALDLLPTFLAAAEAEPLSLEGPLPHEDRGNRKRANRLYGAYDGRDLLAALSEGEGGGAERALFWRLQGQSAVFYDGYKLLKPSHRPAQLFAPGSDPGEQIDLARNRPEKLHELFEMLGEWEFSLATVPLWDSSPRWSADSAKIYDTEPIEEPK